VSYLKLEIANKGKLPLFVKPDALVVFQKNGNKQDWIASVRDRGDKMPSLGLNDVVQLESNSRILFYVELSRDHNYQKGTLFYQLSDLIVGEGSDLAKVMANTKGKEAKGRGQIKL
ncbi:MAG: hypothetical protein ACKVQS_14565, partial [Fimbriimonadaceae bacterium]